MPLLTPCTVSEPADWVVANLRRPSLPVTWLVPGGFNAYVRVLHPYVGRDTDTAVSALAARLGREVQPEAPTDQLIAGLNEERLEGLGMQRPEPGEIPATVARSTAAALARHTTTADRCFFAFWDGWAGMQPIQGYGADFTTPGRRYFLYEAPIAAADEMLQSQIRPGDSTAVAVATATKGSKSPPTARGNRDIVMWDTPNLWWPEDRAWCVATEVDFECTYVACERAAADDLIASGLDAFEIDPTEQPPGGMKLHI